MILHSISVHSFLGEWYLDFLAPRMKILCGAVRGEVKTPACKNGLHILVR